MFRKKNSSPIDTIVRLSALIIAGIFLIVFGAKDFINSFKEPDFLYIQKTSDIKNGAYLQEDIYAALDYFMYEETSRKKYGIEISSSISSYYYIVPVLTEDASELYMAVEVPASNDSEMALVCNDTINYLTGELSAEEFGKNTYYAKGNVRDMKQDEIDFMVEWFQQTEYFGTTDTAEIMNYIHPVILEEYNGTGARIMIIVGTVFVLIGTIILGLFINTKRKQKESSKDLEEAQEEFKEQSFNTTYNE